MVPLGNAREEAEGGMELVVEFKEDVEQPTGGRRAKAEKDRKRKMKPGSFETMGLSQSMVRAIKRKGYQLPTPIQRKTLPLALSGQDVVGMARTGSGKTAAFVIPMLERLKEHCPKAGAQALVLAPTRELVIQLHKAVKELARYTDLRLAVLVGGDSMEAQFAELAANPDIILATPGRLMHHLQEVEGMSLQSVQYCVFDEADQLFEMGFAEQLRAILSGMGDARQTLLFSATLPAALAEFARAGLKSPAFVRLDADTKLSPDLGLCFACVRQEDKAGALLWLLQEVVPQGSPTLIFTATRHHVEFLHNLLTKEGLKTVCVYGQMDQAARRIHSSKFRAGIASILIVTDVAARGIDLPFLDNVINYDFPAKPKLFIHRAGRAARAGRSGMAYSFFTRDELPYLLDLHLLLSRAVVPAPAAPLLQAAQAASSLSASTSLYGLVPQAPVDDAAERVRVSIRGASDLQVQQQSCSNAWDLYRRTRPAASPESAARARTLEQPGPHPLLAAACPSYTWGDAQAQEEAADVRAKLRAYRPSATVLEAELAPARQGEGAGTLAGPGMAGNQGSNSLVEVMREKRNVHGKAIKAAQQQRRHNREDALRAAAPPQEHSSASPAELRAAAAEAARVGDPGMSEPRFRDPDCFIADQKASRYEDKDFAVNREEDALASAVLDLQQDDAAGMASQQRRYHWDARKRKYIQMQPDEEVKAGKRRTKTGGKVQQQESGLYTKWVKHSKMRMPRTGEALDSTGPVDLSERFKRGGRGWQNPLKAGQTSGGAAEELKTPDQVRKQVKQKKRQQEQMQQRQSKTGKHTGGKRTRK